VADWFDAPWGDRGETIRVNHPLSDSGFDARRECDCSDGRIDFGACMVSLIAKRIDLLEYLVFLGVAMAGFTHASWRWVGAGTLGLFLLGLPRWRDLIIKAATVDARYRELGRAALTNGLVGTGIRMYGKACSVLIVVASKLAQDAIYLGAAFAVGVVVARL
jgi:hypothetical protein